MQIYSVIYVTTYIYKISIVQYNQQIQHNQYNQSYITRTQPYTYSPTVCTPIEYKFTFIFDKTQNEFKVHGIWPDVCLECTTCSYPTCCNIENVIYTEPYDPTNFIQTKWFNTTTTEDCTRQDVVSLFKHEYYKHISCSNDMNNTTEFLNKTIDLYNKYYETYVREQCIGYSQIWLSLDQNYNYVSSECVN